MNKIAQCWSQYLNTFAAIVVNVRWVRMLFECWAVGDPQFWFDIRMAAYPERTAEFVEAHDARANAPKASDVELWPACQGEADDSQKRAAINFWPRRSPRLKSRSWIYNKKLIFRKGWVRPSLTPSTHWDIHNSESGICRALPSFTSSGNLSDPSRNL